MYIKYWTNRLPVCPLHTLRLCYLLILENCILTTTIGITVIVISTSCGSLKLTSFVEYLCSHVHYNTFVLVLSLLFGKHHGQIIFVMQFL